MCVCMVCVCVSVCVCVCVSCFVMVFRAVGKNRPIFDNIEFTPFNSICFLIVVFFTLRIFNVFDKLNYF